MEDYVTYEIATKLKELGFNWECFYFYKSDKILQGSAIETGDESWTVETDNFKENWNHFGGTSISAPTLSQAQKWLREIKRIHIWIESEPNEYDNDITYAIYIWDNNKREFPTYYEGAKCEDTYEKALSAGIDKALELLK